MAPFTSTSTPFSDATATSLTTTNAAAVSSAVSQHKGIEIFEWVGHVMKRSYFQLNDDGVMISYAPADHIELEVCLWEPARARGHKTEVLQVCRYSSFVSRRFLLTTSYIQIDYAYPGLNGKIISMTGALKRFTYTEESQWWTTWFSKELATWHEGSRLAHLFLDFGVFRRAAVTLGVPLFSE